MLGQQVTQLADGAVLVVREDVHDDRRAAGPVRFVLRLFIRHAGLFAGAAPDSALDVLGRHVLGLGVGDDGAQTGVHIGVAAAGASRDGELLDDAREDLPALGVERALLVLDRRPIWNGLTCLKNPRKTAAMREKILPQAPA